MIAKRHSLVLFSEGVAHCHAIHPDRNSIRFAPQFLGFDRLSAPEMNTLLFSGRCETIAFIVRSLCVEAFSVGKSMLLYLIN